MIHCRAYTQRLMRAAATVAKATAGDVDRAVTSAQAALDSTAWGGILPAERGRRRRRDHLLIGVRNPNPGREEEAGPEDRAQGAGAPAFQALAARGPGDVEVNRLGEALQLDLPDRLEAQML